MALLECIDMVSFTVTLSITIAVAVSYSPVREPNATAMGITHIDAFKTSGKFTCERSGIYLIAAFVQSNTHENGFTITKNNQGIADAFGSLTGEYETAT
jgi:hypothetical protein